MSAPTSLTSKDVAEALGIDAKALRVYLRSGKAEGLFDRDGKSYVFTKGNVAKLKKGYAAYVADRDAAKAARVKAAEEAKAAEVVVAEDDEAQAS